MWWPFAPRQISEDVYQLRAPGCKVTAILEKDAVVLIDAGGRFSAGPVEAGLRSLGRSLRDVRLIALTHYHPDHTGGLAGLVAASGAEVASHSTEAGFLCGDQPPPSPFRVAAVSAALRPVLPFTYGACVPVQHRLNDGDVLPGPTEVQVVHSPGHTAGSVCYYLPASKSVIVGDALQHRFRRLSPPAWLVTRDVDEARRSIGKLASLDIDTVLFGHFSAIVSDGSGALRRLASRWAG